MALDREKIKDFWNSVLQAARTIRETVKEDGYIQVFSHLDADGLAAAGIIGKALFRCDAKFLLE